MAYDLEEDLGADPVTETESCPDFPPCPNCRLNGGRCCPVDFYFSEDDADLARDGFEIECTLCDAATEPTQPTEARALELWIKGNAVHLGNFAARRRGNEGLARYLNRRIGRSGHGRAAPFGGLIRAFRGARRLFDEIRDVGIGRGNRAPEFGSPLRYRRAATADRLCGAPGSCSSCA